MQEILSRRDAVRRVAKRFGYSDERAEDIAQEAALRLVENPKRISQSARQAFVDIVRGRREGMRSRNGIVHQPVFESAFEDYASFVNAHGSDDDLEGRTIARSELFDALDCFEVLKPRASEMLRSYAEGFTMDEISQRFGITESRVSQIIEFSRKRLKAAIVSQSLSRQEQRQREWRKSQAIPRKAKARSGVHATFSFTMAAFRCQAIEGMVSFKVPKVPQSLFTSF